MKTITIKNISGVDKTYAGQTIIDTETYTVQEGEQSIFSASGDLYTDVAAGTVEIGNGTTFFTIPIEGWSWMANDLSEVHVSQKSDSQGEKIAAHVSSKPILPGKSFYATWTGAGDDVTGGDDDGKIGGGELLVFKFENDATEMSKKARFHPMHGDFYIHDGYIKWSGACIGSSLTVTINADATQLQQAANLDLVVDNDGWISHAPGGPGTGTDGFAATPVLVPRSYSKDGDWNYSTAGGLTPNMDGTGGFKMSTSEKIVHTFVQKMPLIGDADNYMKLYSEESTLMPSGFYIDVIVSCPEGDNLLEAAAIIYAYRQKTTHTP